ncbi:Serine threonine- kinase CTR1 [Chlorella sorokiniana]|uniref:Serine threonine-kinase CTR1 n=1 Tax=Chlorella sorokiniana TaxID=3076 RepID=A0A2P6TUF0_CHLSO|nr:Serine threonine- kinase CTR1 [Chlorella sorokiniana]|eukprot:PRW57695.1 Serine threonine- kinase CTR1 [Chlorella sorokiniana]
MPSDKATLGSGSYGRVYKAKLHETPVAVKVLLDLEEAQAAEPEAVWSLSNPILSNLRKESSLMASLQHPNIVQFMGVCTRPPAMITEYCSRGSLAEVLKGAKTRPDKLRALTWTRRLAMALDAAKGMLYLHESGVVHRDLKSPNLLVDKSWKVKVADFNLSKILDTDTGSGRSALANMNPRWLAPEILSGEAATRASDVFSWGVVMWEILTLQLPWPHVKTWAVVGKLTNGERLVAPPRDKVPGADTPAFQGLDAYVTLMERCWAPRPEERPGFREIIRQTKAQMGCVASKDAKDPWALCQAGALGSLVHWLDTPGSNVDAVDPAKGRGTLLHAAAAADQAECVKLLLKSGADVDLPVEGLGTALHTAAANGSGNAVTLLLANGASPEAQHQGRTAAEVAQLKGFSATANLIRMMAQKPPAPTEPDVDSKSTDASGGTPLKRGAPGRATREAAAAKLALVKKQLSEADAEAKWAQRTGPLIDRPTGSAPAQFGAVGPLGTGPSWERPQLAGAQPAALQPAGVLGSEDVVPELPTPAMVRQTSKERREASRAALEEQLERQRQARQSARDEAERRRAADSLEHRQQLEGLKPPGGRTSLELEEQYAALAAAGGGSGRGTPPASGSSLAGLLAGMATPGGLGGLTPGSITPAGATSGAVTPSGRSGGLSRQHSGPEQGHAGAEEAGIEQAGSGSSALQSQPPSVPPSRSHSNQGLGQGGGGGNGGGANGGEAPYPSVTNSGGSTSSSTGVNSNSSVLSDPLLDFVRQAMLSRPAPCDSGPQPNGSGTLGTASLAMLQRTQHAKQAQHRQQPLANGESLSPQPSTSLAGQASGTSTVSTSMRRGSTGSFAVDIRPWTVQFEDLKMQKIIGEGSYGKVYAAKFHETLVAVKVLLDLEEAQKSAGPDAVWTLSNPILFNLQKECALMASLRHPNIVQFMGFSTCPPAMITEYCARGSLADVLRAAKSAPAKLQHLTWLRRLNMALDATKGMLYLHKKGIVHRDLKSPNLLVEATWKVKVADFNLSKILDTDTGSGRSTIANMNPRWLAPEILNGEAATPASDVFSWGVVMWEILTLELPWPHVGPWSLVGKLMDGVRLEVPPRDQIPGSDTPTFQYLDTYIALMKRCWAQHPEDRPGFEEVIHEVRAMLEAHSKAVNEEAKAAGGGGGSGSPLLTADSSFAAAASPLAGGAAGGS